MSIDKAVSKRFANIPPAFEKFSNEWNFGALRPRREDSDVIPFELEKYNFDSTEAEF